VNVSASPQPSTSTIHARDLGAARARARFSAVFDRAASAVGDEQVRAGDAGASTSRSSASRHRGAMARRRWRRRRRSGKVAIEPALAVAARMRDLAQRSRDAAESA
jgi:hypothetical protein